MFPLILLAAGLFPTIDLIYIYSQNEYLSWLNILSYISLSTYGIFTSLVPIQPHRPTASTPSSKSTSCRF